MKIEEVQLYKKVYRGSKVAFNSRRGVGKIIEGIAIDIDSTLNVIILRDYDNFPHCVSLLSLEEV